MGKYEKLANDIVKEIGGTENVRSVTHCITRLRFVLKDEKKAADETIKNMKGVVTVMHSAGQYQVVIGNQVNDVYEDVIAIPGMPVSGAEEEDDSGEKKGVLNTLMDIISGSFSPILAVLCAGGIIKGLNSLFVFLLGSSFNTTGTYMILNAAGDAIFTFLPVALGYSSAKKFKLNPMIGMVIGLALCYPNIQTDALSAAAKGKALGTIPLLGSYYKTFLGIPFISGNYTSTVVPVIVVNALAAKLEKLGKKFIPQVIQNFFVPLFVLIVAIPLGFLIIGPVVSFLTNLLMNGFQALYKASPVATGAVVGFFWQALVIFGLHWALVPLGLMNLSNLGYDTILFTGMFGASFAQTAALFAMYLKMKDPDEKALALPAVISGICGVTEPSIYGFTLPAKKPFIFSMIGGGVAGGLINALGAKCYIYGGLGAFGFTNYISPKGDAYSSIIVLIATAIAMVIGFVLTWFFYKPATANDAPVTPVVPETNVVTTDEDTDVLAPLAGKVIDLAELKDAAFGSGALGQGVGIEPDVTKDGAVYAPVSGVVTTLFPTYHAIGLTSDDGVEVLVHVGLNTVELNGKGFSPKIKQGDHVTAGQLMMNVDFKFLKDNGYEIQTPVVITNTPNFKDVVPQATTGKAKEVVMKIIK